MVALRRPGYVVTVPRDTFQLYAASSSTNFNLRTTQLDNAIPTLINPLATAFRCRRCRCSFIMEF